MIVTDEKTTGKGMHPEFLIHGIDTLQCAYYLFAKGGPGIDFDRLATEKEALRQSKSHEPKAVTLGNLTFPSQASGAILHLSFTKNL